MPLFHSFFTKFSKKGLRKKGVEPLRPFGHKILSLARLPVPPLPHEGSITFWCASELLGERRASEKDGPQWLKKLRKKGEVLSLRGVRRRSPLRIWLEIVGGRSERAPLRRQNRKADSLARTLFRVFLHEMLGENYQAENLRPFRDDVAHHLAPFSVRIHLDERDYPSDPSDDQKNAKSMIAEKRSSWRALIIRRPAAFRRLLLVQIFRGQHGNDHAGPIRNRVAKKRAPMRAWIGFDVEENPEEHNGDSADAQRMLPQETFLAWRSFRNLASFRSGRGFQNARFIRHNFLRWRTQTKPPGGSRIIFEVGPSC
jgi:hypothetical protein